MNKRRAMLLAGTLACCLALAGGVLAITLSDRELPWRVVSSGGGKAESASYAIHFAVGQTAAGLSDSANYQIQAGFWPGVGVSHPYVPPLSEVWVDDDYCEGCANDGHEWDYDAFNRIQDGIDAVTGGIVRVAAGTYRERISLRDGVQVIGAGAGESVIDAAGLGGSSVEATGTAIGRQTVLAGFTIQGGEHRVGGGVWISYGASPIIRDNVIQGNSANEGGGILIEGTSSRPLIVNNVVTGNSAIRAGGGISARTINSKPSLVRNVISYNTCDGNGGGDIRLEWLCSLPLQQRDSSQSGSRFRRWYLCHQRRQPYLGSQHYCLQ